MSHYIKIKNNYGYICTDGTGAHRLYAMVNDEWVLLPFSGFARELTGALVAVSGVCAFGDGVQFTFVNCLVLGVTDGYQIKLVLKDEKLITLPGDVYKQPIASDNPRCDVVSLRPDN